MATPNRRPAPTPKLNFEQALEVLSREERFMATVSAMNALLVQKGVYSAEEFEELFCGWAENQLERAPGQRIGHQD